MRGSEANRNEYIQRHSVAKDKGIGGIKCVPLHDVGVGRGSTAMASPVGVEVLTLGFVDALVSVGAKVVTLGLDEVGRAAGAT